MAVVNDNATIAILAFVVLLTCGLRFFFRRYYQKMYEKKTYIIAFKTNDEPVVDLSPDVAELVEIPESEEFDVV